MTRAEYEKIYGPEPVGGAWENKNGGWVWNPTGNRQAIFDWNARLQAMADQGQLHRDAQGNIITGGASAGHGSPVATVNPNTWDVGRYTGGDIVNGVPRNLPPVLGGTGTQPFDFNSPEANRLRPNLANRRRY